MENKPDIDDVINGFPKSPIPYKDTFKIYMSRTRITA